jgi:quercetin dioxygenase-like cupin family protein
MSSAQKASSPDAPEVSGSLLDELFALRDAQNAERKTGRLLVREEEATLETNRQGTMRWYIHPSFTGLVDHNTLFYRYEIPPHSATGRQHRQGNVVSYVITGHGYTEVDGVRHDWEAGDVIGLPPRVQGLTFQHVNLSDETALLVTAEPNLYQALGVEMGAGYEQLADAPEAGTVPTPPETTAQPAPPGGTLRHREGSENPEGRDDYERFLDKHHERHFRAQDGDIVIHRKDKPIQRTRQADSTWWLNSQTVGQPDNRAAVQDWDIFMHHIREHTGAHSHQGGLLIYVVDGKGATDVGGKQVDWKAGDLLLLPITAGGIPHQHFNHQEGDIARWVAFIHRPMQDALGSAISLIQDSSDVGAKTYHDHDHDEAHQHVYE